MLKKIKNIFSKSTEGNEQSPAKEAEDESQNIQSGELASISILDADKAEDLQAWANETDYDFTLKTDQSGFALQGEVEGYAWRMERGSPSREYINHTELRGRVELGLNEDVQMMVMSRSLKRALDNNVFSQFTDTLQTIAHSRMPEEMLWLTMYPEVGWKTLTEMFVEFFSILAESKQHAHAWINDDFVEKMTKRSNMNQHLPFVMMIMRGKLYIRCEFDDNPDTLAGLVDLFECAARSAHESRDTFNNLA